MKNLKRIALIIAAMLAIISMVVLMSACGEDENEPTPPTSSSSTSGTTDNSKPDDSSKPDEKDELEENPNLVRVNVVDEKGKPVNGATVQICQGELCFAKPIKTGADGKGTREYTLDGTALKAKVLKIDGMTDYLTPGELGYIYFDAGSREITIKIKKVTVNVFDTDGKAVEGAVVQLSQGEHILGANTELVTDADGVASGFVALSGEEIFAKVTEILSGGSYELEDESYGFGIGTYDGTVTVKKLLAYVVKISTMLGENLSDVKVQLFDSKNRMRKTLTTDENGIARFENVDPDDYYVKVTINDPRYVIITENTDGKYYFKEGSTTLNLDAVVVTDITYTITVSNALAGQTVKLYNYDSELVAFGETDENGVASIVAPYGEYIAVLDSVYFAEYIELSGEKLSGEITVTNEIAGSTEYCPKYIFDTENLSFEANSEYVWYEVVNYQGKLVVIEKISGDYAYGYNFTGYLGTDFETIVLDETGLFNIGPYENSAELTLTVKVPGTHSSPIDITNDSSVDVSIKENHTTYYTYTALENGVLKITVDKNVIISFEGVGQGLKYDDQDKVTYIYPLCKDESVIIGVSSYDEDTNSSVALDTALNVAYGKENKSYTVKVLKEGELSEGTVVILYTKVNGELTEIARGTTNANGEYVFESIDYASNYVVKVEYPEGYTSVYEEVEFGTELNANVYMTTIKTGSVDLPFDFDTIGGEESTTINAGSTVWYTVNVRPSNDGTKFTLTVNSASVVIKVYYTDTNNDGIIDENDTPIGASTVVDGKAVYTFNSNDRVYKIAVSTTNNEAEDVTLTYASKSTQEGETVDNAIEITEAGEYKASLNNSCLYYRYTGEAATLTVTVTSDNGTLKTVTLSIDADPVIEAVDGNTFTIETEGNWIYFAIESGAQAEVTFTVTVE